MKKILTFAMVAGGALVLSACGGKTEEAPVAEETAAEEMMAAEETPAAEEPMAADTPAATEEVDPTSNPIPPS